MEKRGQATIFIIIGLVIIAAVIFLFILFRSFQEKAREITNPQEYLKSQINDIKKSLVKCIDEESRVVIRKLSLQGGHLDPIKYVNYYGNKTSFLCYKVKQGETCYNMMFTREDVSSEIKPVLSNNIKKCMDNGLIVFRNKDYVLTTGDYSFDLTFSDATLLVAVDYPITLTKGNAEDKQRTFSKDIKSNFWKSVNLASAIVNLESKGEVVDVAEMSPNNLDFEIGRTEVSGGNLYILAPRNGFDPIFYFAVEK
ncbi:hypothetical protein HYU23_03310 [Candidatus Woesearchaeota archaeon]|nr:hypothetical protein [Candidatus Woesearchaeota archaeon]